AGRAPIDAFGVGTSISTVSDAPSLGGVYKLVETEHDGLAVPTVKLSSGKRTYPGRKQVWRIGPGVAEPEVIGLEAESMREGRPRLSCVLRQGKRLRAASPVMEMAFRARARLAELPPGIASLDGTDKYPVAISGALDRLARDAVHAHGGT